MLRWLPVVLAACGVPGATAADFTAIERGRYLTTAGDCVSCHTAPGGAPFAGDRTVTTPFGALLSPNLTPDGETGLGAWTENQFVRAMQDGIGRHGEHLYPGLPYPYFTVVRRADLVDILAFLRTLPPVHNRVDSDRLAFPFNIRAGTVAWNAVNFRPGEYRPNAAKSEEWNRGGYLVEGLGHCGACHTPKNLLGGDDKSRLYQGGVVNNWYAPDIAGDGRQGLGGWSVDDVATYLKTGQSRTSLAGGPMAEVIERSTSHLDEADLRAVAVYLKDQPGPGTPAPAPLPPYVLTMRAGAAIYADLCSSCHTPRGEGVRGLFPALAGSPSLQNDDATTLVRTVLRGGRAAGTDSRPGRPAMPSYGTLLDDEKVAAVVNYVRNSWNNAAPEVTPRDVRVLRAALDDAAD